MGGPRPLAAIANERVPFSRAAQWAGLGADSRDRGLRARCPACGEGGAMRVYDGHAYCYAERRRFSAVTLLAEVWDMDRESAAIRALKKVGYAPPGYAHLWDQAAREPEPALDDLAAALRTWCAANCPDWATRQYDDQVSRRLAFLLGLLRLVRTEEQCTLWLEKCKKIMSRAF